MAHDENHHCVFQITPIFYRIPTADVILQVDKLLIGVTISIPWVYICSIALLVQKEHSS